MLEKDTRSAIERLISSPEVEKFISDLSLEVATSYIVTGKQIGRAHV